MGTKLTRTILYFFVIIFFGCKSNIDIQDDNEREAYIQAYRSSVFYGCLNESTNGNFQKFLKENNDLGLNQEVALLYHAELERAVKLGAKLSKKIEPIAYADYEGLLPNFSSCLRYAMYNHEVDSIANFEYERSKTGEMIYIYDE